MEGNTEGTPPLTQTQKIEKLRETTVQCRRCPLREEASGVVFGEGNPEASIVLCGEGPGFEEDRQLRPFVGQAGQLLDRILQASGFERFQHTYILNVVKCRPPGNRTPTDEERATCAEHLQAQLAIIRPKIIVLMGATAVKTLVSPQARITRMRGQWVRKGSVWLMPTYHPAALLRNNALKRDTWNDFKQVIDKYRETIDPDHDTPHYPLKGSGS